jgi:hypothetical protein
VGSPSTEAKFFAFSRSLGFPLGFEARKELDEGSVKRREAKGDCFGLNSVVMREILYSL